MSECEISIPSRRLCGFVHSLTSINVGYLEITQISLSQLETACLFEQVLHPWGLRGAEHISTSVNYGVDLYKGEENGQPKLLDMITVARIVGMACIYAFYLAGIQCTVNSSKGNFDFF